MYSNFTKNRVYNLSICYTKNVQYIYVFIDFLTDEGTKKINKWFKIETIFKITIFLNKIVLRSGSICAWYVQATHIVQELIESMIKLDGTLFIVQLPTFLILWFSEAQRAMETICRCLCGI